MISYGDFDIHFKLLLGETLLAVLVGRSVPQWPDWIADNTFVCKETLQSIQDVLGAFCKGGDITQNLLEKRLVRDP